MGGIAKSVGKGGKNQPDDVQIVKDLLNKHRTEVGFGKLKDGDECDKDTIKAIEAVQLAIGMQKPDGRVDPGGKTFKALEAGKLPKAEEAKPAGKAGKVTGNLSGVNSDIVDFVKAVAEFYGRDIAVSDGSRTAKDQGVTMFKYWDDGLKRGKIYTYLKSNPKLLKQLDQLYTDANDKSKPKKEADEAKESFVKICTDNASRLSMHVAGKAIDVSPKSCMTTAMRAAMETGLYELEEKKCYHYDTRNGAAPKVTDALKKNWKAP